VSYTTLYFIPFYSRNVQQSCFAVLIYVSTFLYAWMIHTMEISPVSLWQPKITNCCACV